VKLLEGQINTMADNEVCWGACSVMVAIM
jgi:hypothetical protein